jgi:hypothetical protein
LDPSLASVARAWCHVAAAAAAAVLPEQNARLSLLENGWCSASLP